MDSTRTLTAFGHVSLDGYFVDGKGDMSWAHKRDAEWNAFVTESAGSDSELVFGRTTYQMMAGYWPTAQASQASPRVAERMNQTRKVVFSRTLDTAAWNNTKLVKDDITASMRRMKNEPGKPMVILGSGSIVSQMAQEGLIDEFQIVLNPLAVGNGRTYFDGIKGRLNLTLAKTRAFSNGNMLLCYTPG
jgi:dihydrofolate reductase